MCLIVSAPKGNQIPLELLQDATRKNADGWGVMYHDGRQIVTLKSHKPDARAIYDITQKLTHATVVHLRMATHGGTDQDNTHPFEVVPNRLYMMHNGVIDVDVPKGSRRSDTRIVVEDYLKPLIGAKPGRLHNLGLRRFIQTMIGDSGNRLVFLDDQGALTYFNRSLGIEWRGLWCSNTYAWTLWDDRLARSALPHKRDWSRTHYTDRYWDRKGSIDDILYDFDWAPGSVQAANDLGPLNADDMVLTDAGYEIPAYISGLFDMDEFDLGNEDPRLMAAALVWLRDNYIGEQE